MQLNLSPTVRTELWNCNHDSLTPSSYQEPLAKAEALFSSLETLKQNDKRLLIDHLNEVFQELSVLPLTENNTLSSTVAQATSRICYLYGRCLYGDDENPNLEDMNHCYHLFLLALAFQLAQVDLLKVKHLPSLNSYSSLKSFSLIMEPSHASHIINKLITNSPEHLSETVLKQGPEKAFAMAASLRWLGHTCQFLEAYKKRVHCTFFRTIYQQAQVILNRLDTFDSRWEIALIHYHSSRFIHYLHSPGDIQGALETLTILDPYLTQENGSLRAQVLKAQIHNTRLEESSKIFPTTSEESLALLHYQFDAASQAAHIAQTTEGFDSSLKIGYLNNKAFLAFIFLKTGSPVATIQEIEQWFQEILTTVKAKDYNHPYHIYYLINAAKVSLYSKNHDRAMEYLNLAESLCGKYPENADVQELLDRIQSMQLQIL